MLLLCFEYPDSWFTNFVYTILVIQWIINSLSRLYQNVLPNFPLVIPLCAKVPEIGASIGARVVRGIKLFPFCQSSVLDSSIVRHQSAQQPEPRHGRCRQRHTGRGAFAKRWFHYGKYVDWRKRFLRNKRRKLPCVSLRGRRLVTWRGGGGRGKGKFALFHGASICSRRWTSANAPSAISARLRVFQVNGAILLSNGYRFKYSIVFALPVLLRNFRMLLLFEPGN